MTENSEDDRCRMTGCTRPAERTVTFERREDIAVCDAHYKRTVAIKYGVLVGISVVLAGLALAARWLVV
ncbi:hypothetical protein [Natronococcus wangiae]|uniref:hypothetical protein n=1 Tax=Natronococcus wangiae TaxID=3068275 RepID=UPI00273DA9CD|nr:hypothetical protein [Natronococcus sp. AD5]